MLRKLPDPAGGTVTVVVDGHSVAVGAHETAAAAALLAGIGFTRTSPVNGEHRAPYCMMGVCHECLMVIDGVPSRQACLVTVRDGMRIDRQSGARMLELAEGAANG
ncbi:MAG: (2Fe-2S)-binding protein [Alphaproteobacteria bacterium]